MVQKKVQWSNGSVQILPMPRFMWFQTWLLLDKHLLQLRTDCFDFFGTTKGIRRKWNVISFSSLFFFCRVFSPFFKALVMFYYITNGGIVFRELFCFIRSSPDCMRANALSCKILFLFSRKLLEKKIQEISVLTVTRIHDLPYCNVRDRQLLTIKRPLVDEDLFVNLCSIW